MNKRSLGLCLLLFIFAWTNLLWAESQEDEFLIEGEGLTFIEEKQFLETELTIIPSSTEIALSHDLTDLIASSSGVALSRNGGYGMVSGLSLRGFGSGRVLFLLNGVPLNSALSGSFDLSSINLANIESIELIKGSSNASLGSGAIGGAIQIVSKTTTSEKPEIRLDFSNISQIPYARSQDLFDTNRLSFSALGNTKLNTNQNLNWNFSFFGTQAGNHYRAVDQFNRSVLIMGNEVQDAGATLNLSYNLSSLSSASFVSHFFWADKNVAGPLYSGYPGNQKDLQTTEILSYTTKRFLTDSLSLKTTLAHTYSNLEWNSFNESSVHELNTLSGLLETSYFISDAILFAGGSEASLSFVKSTNIEADFVYDADGAFWLSSDLNFIPSVKITPSVRVCLGQTSLPQPHLGFLWRPKNFLQLSSHVYSVFRLPSIQDRYWSGAGAQGNPDLVPESGWGSDIELLLTKEGLGLFSISFFGTSLKNAIMWGNDNGLRPVNLGKALSWGFDSQVKTSLAGPLNFRLFYSFFDSRVLTGGFTFSDAKRLPYQAMHRLDFSVEAKIKKAKFLIGLHGEGQRFTTMYNTVSLAPYSLVAASLVYPIALPIGSLDLYAKGDNIFATQYETLAGYPMPLTEIKIGCTLFIR